MHIPFTTAVPAIVKKMNVNNGIFMKSVIIHTMESYVAIKS